MLHGSQTSTLSTISWVSQVIQVSQVGMMRHASTTNHVSNRRQARRGAGWRRACSIRLA